MPHLLTLHALPQARPRIVIQGVRGAFHEMAARELFGSAIDLVPALSFDELMRKTADPASADAAVMAIENSLAGSILGNYLLLQNNDLCITGELTIPIRQNLMALPGVRLADLQEVHSHPMALAQCSEYFRQFPHIRLVESEDTAESAARIARNQTRHTGAIAGALAAELYGLHILAPGIETHAANFTRFLALRRRDSAQAPAGANKVSISFRLPHRPGSLGRILGMLAAQSANLTKIQSVPIVGQVGEYLFLVDFTVQNPGVLPETLRLLDVMCDHCRVFGIYKAAPLLETRSFAPAAASLH
ncbi:MAG: prephenate dehydratase [Saprospiraceae bacterium]|nr:prephenate dehydratase [Saprospiraceae bacterium]